MKILLDSDALIKLTKARMKDLLVDTFAVFIPESVQAEVVAEGKKMGHPDAVLIENNISKGRIRIARIFSSEPPESVIFHGGDREVVSLSLSSGFSAVVTDDGALLERLKRLGVSATVPAALILAIGRKRKFSRQEVRHLLEALRPYISKDEYVTYLMILEGRYPGK